MKRIFILIAMLVSAIELNGQDLTYYEASKDYNLGGGVVYRCDVRFGTLAFLFNTANKFTGVQSMHKEVSVLGLSDYRIFSITDEMRAHILKLSKKCFSLNQMMLLRGESVTIFLCVNPQSGHVMEVEFMLHAGEEDKMNQIPPSVFRAIEVALEDDSVYVTPTDFGREYNYIVVPCHLNF